MEVDLKILQELKSDPNKKTFSEDTLRITRGTFEMIKTYAKLCSRIAGSGMECYGYLLMPKDSLDGVITNLYFADEQIVNSAHVRVTDEAVYNASKMMEPQGYQIVGWWHSHGDMEPFHSGWDKDNFVVVTQSVSPRTMYRNKEIVYIADETAGEVKLDTITIRGIDAKKFKESNPKILKKEEGKPYAFSMVVNNMGNYYIERRSKTYNERTNSYELDEPIRPKLEVVDTDEDLEFLISHVEKDIHRKLIFPNEDYASFSQGCPEWEENPAKFRHSLGKQSAYSWRKDNVNNESDKSWDEKINKVLDDGNDNVDANGRQFSSQYTGVINNFSQAAIEYLRSQEGSLGVSTIVKFLLAKPSQYRYDILRDSADRRLNNAAVKKVIEKVKDKEEEIGQNILNALTDTDCKIYFDKDRKLEINELRNLLCTQFMIDFSHTFKELSENKIDRAGFVSNAEKVITEYRKKTLKLAESFSEAVLATKALSYYAMESMTDYKQQKNHKYKGLMTRILSNISATNKISFLDSSLLELKFGSKGKSSHEFFLYPERFNIVNQLTIDLYSYKLEAERLEKQRRSESKNDNESSHDEKQKNEKKEIKGMSQNKKRMLDLLTKFVDSYTSEEVGEEKVDKLIEESLFPCLLISAPNYKKFQDVKKALRDYTEEDKKKHSERDSLWSFITKPFRKPWTNKKEGSGIVRQDDDIYDDEGYRIIYQHPGGVRHLIDDPPYVHDFRSKASAKKNDEREKERIDEIDLEERLSERKEGKDKREKAGKEGNEDSGKENKSDREKKSREAESKNNGEQKIKEHSRGNGKDKSTGSNPWDDIARAEEDEAKKKKPINPRNTQYHAYYQKGQVNVRDHQQNLENGKKGKKWYRIFYVKDE
ncbi:Mov34/MPN/PAD-1 family protein [Candidatus Woesearchaeota archaeon]|nr:Mov34/MPN/PAD-1 family protein [Candidatus Woesearchaeota archaeon]